MKSSIFKMNYLILEMSSCLNITLMQVLLLNDLHLSFLEIFFFLIKGDKFVFFPSKILSLLQGGQLYLVKSLDTHLV